MGYMREKRQFAQVNDQTAELIDVQFRVAQGSILGLALSTLYANDLNVNHYYSHFMSIWRRHDFHEALLPFRSGRYR